MTSPFFVRILHFVEMKTPASKAQRRLFIGVHRRSTQVLLDAYAIYSVENTHEV